jgi:hypothetical protein
MAFAICLRRRWGRKGGTMGRIGIAVTYLAVAVSMLAVATSAGAEEEGEEAASLVACSANKICTFNTEYQIHTISFECAGSGTYGTGGNLLSATNRCGNKTNWLRHNGNVIACMNPGGDRPHPGAYNEVFIAAQYGAFC